MSRSRRAVDVALITAVVALTLATAYIHAWVGGLLLMLNAAGYVGLAGLVVVSAITFRRALPIVLGALAAYAAVTIGGWLVMGPYFDVAYLAKAIEIALIATIATRLRTAMTETRAAIAWARSLAARTVRVAMRRSAPAGRPADG